MHLAVIEQFIPQVVDFIQQIDPSSFLEELADFDWADITAYGAALTTLGGGAWLFLRQAGNNLWIKNEKTIGLIIESFVIFSLWYAVLRMHASMTVGLDTELFDNFLWISALILPAYVLARNDLILKFFVFTGRTMQLTLEVSLFIASWLWKFFSKKNKDSQVVQFIESKATKTQELFQAFMAFVNSDKKAA